MINLKQIKKINNTIECYAYIEDCEEAIHLTLDLSKREFKDYILPNGYEWCKTHIAHAKFALLKMDDENKIEQERLIMWY